MHCILTRLSINMVSMKKFSMNVDALRTSLLLQLSPAAPSATILSEWDLANSPTLMPTLMEVEL